MSKQKAVPVGGDVHIDTAKIPAHVAMNIAQVALSAIQRAYNAPVIREDYRRWKAERRAAAN